MDKVNENKTKDDFEWGKNKEHKIKNYSGWKAFYNANEEILKRLYGAQNETSGREESFKKNIIEPFFIDKFFMGDMKNILGFVREKLGLSFKLSTDSDILNKCSCGLAGLEHISNLLKCLSEKDLLKSVTAEGHATILKRAFAKIRDVYIEPTDEEWSSIINFLAISEADKGVYDTFDVVKAIFAKIKPLSYGYDNIDMLLLPFIKLLRDNRLTLRQQHVTMIVGKINKKSRINSLMDLLKEFQKDKLKLESQDFEKILNNMQQWYINIADSPLIDFLKLLMDLGVKFGEKSKAGTTILKCYLEYSERISVDSAFNILSLLCELSSKLDYENVSFIVKKVKNRETADSVIDFMIKLQKINIKLDLKCIGILINRVDELTIDSAMDFLKKLENLKVDLDEECVQEVLNKISTKSQGKSDSKMQFIKLCQEYELKLTKDQFKDMLGNIQSIKKPIDPAIELLDLVSRLHLELPRNYLKRILDSTLKSIQDEEKPMDSVIKLLDSLNKFKSDLSIYDFKLAFERIKKINNVENSDQIVELFNKLYDLTGNDESLYRDNIDSVTLVLNKIQGKIAGDGVSKLINYFYENLKPSFNNKEFIEAILNKHERNKDDNIVGLYGDLIKKMVESECDKEIRHEVIRLIYNKMKGGKDIIGADDAGLFRQFMDIYAEKIKKGGKESQKDEIIFQLLKNDLKNIKEPDTGSLINLLKLSAKESLNLKWDKEWFGEILASINFNEKSIGSLAELLDVLKAINMNENFSIDDCFQIVFKKIIGIDSKYDLDMIRQLLGCLCDFAKANIKVEDKNFIDVANKIKLNTNDNKIKIISAFGELGLHGQGYQYIKQIISKDININIDAVEFLAKVITTMVNLKYQPEYLYNAIDDICRQIMSKNELKKNISDFLYKLTAIDNLQLNNNIVEFTVKRSGLEFSECLKLFNQFKKWDEDVSKTMFKTMLNMLNTTQRGDVSFNDFKTLVSMLEKRNIEFKFSQEDVVNILRKCYKRVSYNEIFEFKRLLEDNSNVKNILNLDQVLKLFINCGAGYCNRNGLDNFRKLLNLVIEQTKEDAETQEKHIDDIINDLNLGEDVTQNDLGQIFHLLYEKKLSEKFIPAILKKLKVNNQSFSQLEAVLNDFSEKAFLTVDTVDNLFCYNVTEKELETINSADRLKKIKELLTKSKEKNLLSFKQVHICIQVYSKAGGVFSLEVLKEISKILDELEINKQPGANMTLSSIQGIAECILAQYKDSEYENVDAMLDMLIDLGKKYNFKEIFDRDVVLGIVENPKINTNVEKTTHLLEKIVDYKCNFDFRALWSDKVMNLIKVIPNGSQSIEVMKKFSTTLLEFKGCCSWGWTDMCREILTKVNMGTENIGNIISLIDILEVGDSAKDKSHRKCSYNLEKYDILNIFDALKNRLSVDDIIKLVKKFHKYKGIMHNFEIILNKLSGNLLEGDIIKLVDDFSNHKDIESISCNDLQIILDKLSAKQSDSDMLKIVDKLTEKKIKLDENVAGIIFNKLEGETHGVRKLRLAVAMKQNNNELNLDCGLLTPDELNTVASSLKIGENENTNIKNSNNSDFEINTNKINSSDNNNEKNNTSKHNALVIDGVMLTLQKRLTGLDLNKVDAEKEDWIAIFEEMKNRELNENQVISIKQTIDSVCNATDFVDVIKTIASIVGTVLTLGILSLLNEDIKNRSFHPVNTGVFYRLKSNETTLIGSLKRIAVPNSEPESHEQDLGY